MSVKIKNEFLEAKINLKGAELKSLKSNEGIEYIWYSDPKFWGKSAPFLFPIVGRLKNNKTMIKGKEYIMGNHGFLQTQDFHIIENQGHRVVLVSTSNEETLNMYPYLYQISITYELIEKTLRTTFKIQNKNKEAMPFNYGGHPAFNVPLYQGEKFEDYRVVFEKEESFDSPLVLSDATLNFDISARKETALKELPLKREIFSIDTVVIPRSRSKKVYLLNQKDQGIEFSFPGFITFAVWSPFNTEAPFVCLEPWIGNNDHHDTKGTYLEKDNIILLEENQEFEVYYDIHILNENKK